MTKSIAIIDDDETFQFITKKMIERNSAFRRIFVFSNGKEAIDYFESVDGKEANELPEVILLDLNMPIMDGWEFLDEYIHLTPKPKKKTHLYIVSSSVDESDINKAKTISAVTDYIEKPITSARVKEIYSFIGE